MRIAALILFLLVFCSVGRPCSCVSLGYGMAEEVKSHLNSAGVVFEGKAGEYFNKPGADRATIHFTVLKVWKGEVTPEFELSTDILLSDGRPMSMDSCEYTFTKDKTYIIFAFKTKKGWMTSDCTGTTEVRDREWDQEVLKALGPWKEPKKEVSLLLQSYSPFEFAFTACGD
jgi:hypothetical protein